MIFGILIGYWAAEGGTCQDDTETNIVTVYQRTGCLHHIDIQISPLKILYIKDSKRRKVITEKVKIRSTTRHICVSEQIEKKSS